MSQVNVEVVRQSLVAFDRHDRPAWLALRDEKFEVIPSGIWPEAEVILGREAAWELYVEVIELSSGSHWLTLNSWMSGPTQSWPIIEMTCAARQAGRK